MYYTVFVTTNMFDGKKYIGHHKTDYINDTWLGSGLLLKNAIRKQGRKNFKKKVLFVFDNEDDMVNKATEIIVKYKPEYNLDVKEGKETHDKKSNYKRC